MGYSANFLLSPRIVRLAPYTPLSDEFDSPRSASAASNPFHLRAVSFRRLVECTRTSYRSTFVERSPSGPPSTSTEYALPTGGGLMFFGDGQLVDFWRCVAVHRRFSTSNLEMYARPRADLGPRAEQQR